MRVTPEAEEDLDEVQYQNLLWESTTPVYDGCHQNRIQSAIVLMTLVSVYGVLDSFLTAIFTYLAGNLLLRSNCLPRTAFELKMMVRKLGLEHKRIHCCPEGHVLFEGPENGNLERCPTCQHPRYVRGSSSVPVVVMRYFPLIKKVKRIYRCPRLGALVEHHANAPLQDNTMRSIVESVQWQHISREYPEFCYLASHLRLALIIDGVCPHGNQSSKHSTWVIFIAIYNFPGWLATKKNS